MRVGRRYRQLLPRALSRDMNWNHQLPSKGQITGIIEYAGVVGSIVGPHMVPTANGLTGNIEYEGTTTFYLVPMVVVCTYHWRSDRDLSAVVVEIDDPFGGYARLQGDFDPHASSYTLDGWTDLTNVQLTYAGLFEIVIEPPLMAFNMVPVAYEDEP